MGREVKRVALDFEWPLKKIWEGYLNPYYKECRACRGRGDTPSAHAFERLVGLLMIAGEESARGKAPHPWLQHAGIADVGDRLHEVTTGLAEKEPEGLLGYDGGAQFRVMKKILKAAGLDTSWCRCDACGGEGVDPEVREACEAWEPYDPPAGDGWQMWETVTEGSPISPVFETPEKLARWLADNGASASGFQTASYEQWLGMIQAGSAPSAVMDERGMHSGVEFVGGDS